MENDNNQITQKISISKKYFGGLGLSAVYIIAFFAMQIIGMAIMFIISIVMGIDTENFMSNSLVLCTTMSAIMIAIWYYFAYGRKKEEREKLSLKGYAILVLLSIGMYFVSSFLATITSGWFEDAGSKFDQLMEMIDMGNPVLTFFAAALMAPLGEECLLRGMVLRNLQKYKFSVTAAIIIQGVLFGVIHGNLIQGIYAIPLGILYGYVAYRTKSVWPSIMMHFINNSISQIVSMIG